MEEQMFTADELQGLIEDLFKDPPETERHCESCGMHEGNVFMKNLNHNGLCADCEVNREGELG